MTWKLPNQNPCAEPCCTGGELHDSDPPVLPIVTREPVLRECGTTGCVWCDPVRQWIEDTDPDPVPGGGDKLPGHGKARPLKREPGGVSTQSTNNGLPNRKATT